MQGVHRDTAADSDEHVDTQAALWLLASLAGFYRQPFDAELVIKRFPPPIDLPTLIEALGALGLKAGLTHWPEAGLSDLPLPAVALLPAPETAPRRTVSSETEIDAPQEASRASLTPALIVRHGGDTVARVKAVQPEPETVALETTRAQAAPVLLLVVQGNPTVPESVSRAEQPEAQKRPFGFSWFVPKLLRHKHIWRDVLLASLAIQLVGLATPLFTQVIIEKVIAHHSESTLIELGVALVAFMFFTSCMTWLHQYLVLHTGSRIDAVLGEEVLKHLLHLPIPYFEASPTGTLVARLHGVEQLREFISSAAVSLVLDLPFLLIFLAVMFSYSWQLTLIVVGILALIVVASLTMVPIFRERLDKQFLLGARNQAFLTEYLAGIATVKSLQLEPDVGKRYDTYLAQYLSAGFATKQVGNTYNVVANALEQVMTLAILGAGASLVMQTRLKPYLDQIDLVIDDTGLRLDAAQLNQMLAGKQAVDPENYLADLLDLDRYANGFLSGTNWSGLADFDTLIDTLPQTAGVTALLDQIKVRRLTAGDDNTGLTDKAVIVLAGMRESRCWRDGVCANDEMWGVAA